MGKPNKSIPRKSKLPTESPMVEVAKWFRGRRAELGMTQAQYAAMLGLPPLLISKLERGSVGISLPTLLAALEATGGLLSVSTKPVDLDMAAILNEENSND